MKKIFTLLLVFCCFVNGFAQQSSEVLFQKKTAIFKDGYIYKNQHFVDIDSSDYEEGKLIDMSNLTTREQNIKKILSNGMRLSSNTVFPIDSVPETAIINVNGVVFNSRKILTKLSDYTIFHIKKDSIYTYEYRTKKDSAIYSNVRVKYRQPKAMVYQAHPSLPYNFFVFKLNTLEPIRYTSSSYSPVLDVVSK
jgi:hypothetical protein